MTAKDEALDVLAARTNELRFRAMDSGRELALARKRIELLEEQTRIDEIAADNARKVFEKADYEYRKAYKRSRRAA